MSGFCICMTPNHTRNLASQISGRDGKFTCNMLRMPASINEALDHASLERKSHEHTNTLSIKDILNQLLGVYTTSSANPCGTA
ncbi:MAG TPA: hypothetical protein VE199_02825 [Nitrososphaera sp.]|jgi:hypothetical protein|nr:hypothetical protein [Nitrososphaera sp.]